MKNLFTYMFVIILGLPMISKVTVMIQWKLNQQAIADKLCINIRTVETHRKRVMEKTHAKNFIGVVLFALKHNYILLDDL